MKTFWIKKTGVAAVDIFTTWGIRIKSIPPKPYPNPKDIAKRDWPDEQGDDEYIPPVAVIASDSVNVKFFYKGELDSISDNIVGFLEYIQGCELSFYDENTGRKGIFRYESYSEDAVYHRDGDGLVFTVKFKINNPALNGEL